MPGQLGNSAIAGHRTTYGQPFFRLDEVEPGDEIVLTTVQGRFVYRMTAQRGRRRRPVRRRRHDRPDGRHADADHVPPPVHGGQAADRVRRARHRGVSAAPQPPVDRAPTAAPATDAARRPRRRTASPTPAPTPTPATATDRRHRGDRHAVAADDDGRRATRTADAFAHGWFSDDAAFAQVALWGLALTAIAIGACLLSRRSGATGSVRSSASCRSSSPCTSSSRTSTGCCPAGACEAAPSGLGSGRPRQVPVKRAGACPGTPGGPRRRRRWPTPRGGPPRRRRRRRRRRPSAPAPACGRRSSAAPARPAGGPS